MSFMENELVKLHVIGITYNQIENGMYAMVLEEDGGHLRLPIIIGYNEAQSIECVLQKISTPRPLTHELTARILDSFGVGIDRIVIRQLPNGIFTADIVLVRDGETHSLDARSSDAIALAMRAGAPIFTTRQLLDTCGVCRDSFAPSTGHFISNQSIPVRQATQRMRKPNDGSIDSLADEQLMTMMQEAVENEDYEKADEIKQEIQRRKASAQEH